MYELLLCVITKQPDDCRRAGLHHTTLCLRLVVTHRTVRGLRAGEGVPHVQAVAMRQRHTLQGLQADGSVLHVQAAGMR